MSEMNGKKKRKNILNLVDIFLLVVIVLLLAVFASYRFILADNTVASVELQYDIEVRNVSQHLNTSQLQDDLLYDENGVYMGTVVACSEIEQSQYSMMTAPNNYVFTVTVTCKAKRMKDGSYRINGVVIEKGDALVLQSADFSVSGDCVAITEVTKK